MLDVDVVDVDNWNRGSTEKCQLRLTAAGEAFGDAATGCCGDEAGVLECRYNNGPILSCAEGSTCLSAMDYLTDLRGKAPAGRERGL